MVGKAPDFKVFLALCMGETQLELIQPLDEYQRLRQTPEVSTARAIFTISPSLQITRHPARLWQSRELPV